MPRKLTHYDQIGQVRMVDVSAKPETAREARASVLIKMRPKTLRAVRSNPAKGNPLEIARIAGISAAKKTSDLIPLCHPLMLTHIDVMARFRPDGIEIKSVVRTTGQTGVEMEALTAAAVAALTVYDMSKAIDHAIEITELALDEKSGGKSGRYRRGPRLKGSKSRP
jgi:cyclic pyranopterin monophosphate synthase